MTAADRHRTLAGTELAAALRESRARTLAFTHDLSEAQWQAVPAMRGLNPVAWELAHVAWFAEFWVLRGPHRRDGQGLVHAARPPRRIGPDVMFDSARLPHARRWTAPLPDRGRLAPMMAGQLEDVLAAVAHWRRRCGPALPSSCAAARGHARGSVRMDACAPRLASAGGLGAGAARRASAHHMRGWYGHDRPRNGHAGIFV